MELLERLRQSLEPRVAERLDTVVREADRQGRRLFLVGGPVRDLLLGVTASLDLDIALEGDPAPFYDALVSRTGAKVTQHDRFGTATARWDGVRIDFAMTRTERYPRPGALPTVQPGAIEQDLARRDFTINALALALTGPQAGRLLDQFDGEGDLRRKLVRVLHDRSFRDDATRIVRAIRYEQRLGFAIEPHTLSLLRSHLGMLETISGDRLRHELERTLAEGAPERALLRAQALGVLPYLLPGVTLGPETPSGFERLRSLSGGAPGPLAGWGLLAYGLSTGQVEAIVKRLSLAGAAARVMSHMPAIAETVRALAATEYSPSAVYHTLERFEPEALQAFQAASEGREAQLIDTYLRRLRHIRPELTGHDVMALGAPSGPKVGEALRFLLDQRLDGKIGSEDDERKLVRQWLTGQR